MPQFSLKSSSGKELLGTWGEILERSTKEACAFCALVIKSFWDPPDHVITKVTKRWILDPAAHTRSSLTDLVASGIMCYLTWELDGREDARGRGKRRTRRIHLTSDEAVPRDSYLVLKAPMKDQQSDPDANRDPRLFLGRKISIHRSEQAFLRRWLDQCSDSHQGLCKGSESADPNFCHMLEQSYFGVIDVQDWRLTSLPHKSHRPELPYMGHEPYLALSYTWGQSTAERKPYCTT